MLLTRSRTGFTLVELLIAMVVMGMVGVVALRLLTGTQRMTTNQAERTTLQANTRAGAIIVPSELREISASGANPAPNPAVPDLVAIAPTSIDYWASRGTASVCAATLNTVTLTDVSALRDPKAGDRLVVFSDGDPSTASDDSWAAVEVGAGSVAAVCPSGAAARTYTLATSFPAAINGGVAGVTKVILGGGAVPARLQEHMKLELYTAADNVKWLGIESLSGGGGMQPVLGPLTGDGLQFTYRDQSGAVTGARDAVRRIDATLIGVTSRAVHRGLTGAPSTVVDTQRVSIALRN